MQPIKLVAMLSQITVELSVSGLENASTEAEIIASEILGISRAELPIAGDRMIDAVNAEKIQEIVVRRTKHEPLQYILGNAAFRYLVLDVGPGVLIPRPETELLVDFVIARAVKNGTMCDIGCGSGAIAISAAYERPDLQVTGVEISDAAIVYARRNAEKYALKNLKIVQSNLFAALPYARFDVITANLPYVTVDEMQELADEVRLHEPELALVGGLDGLDIIRRLIGELSRHLNKGGVVIFELGIHQAPAVSKLLRQTGLFSNVQTIRDYCQRDRFVAAWSVQRSL